jgi:hypothetical protein
VRRTLQVRLASLRSGAPGAASLLDETRLTRETVVVKLTSEVVLRLHLPANGGAMQRTLAIVRQGRVSAQSSAKTFAWAKSDAATVTTAEFTSEAL